MTTRSRLAPGDPAPWFKQRSFANPSYTFDTAAGRYIVLCFFGSAAEPNARAALEAVRRRGDLFDDAKFSFFGVSVDPTDEREQRVADSYPGYRFFWDFDGRVSQLFGALPADATTGEGQLTFNRLWYVLDPTLRIMRVIPFAADGRDIPALLAYLDALPPRPASPAPRSRHPSWSCPTTSSRSSARSSSAFMKPMAAQNQASCAKSTARPSRCRTTPTSDAGTT